MRYKYDPPAPVKKIFKHFQWDARAEKILLTFDDGPIPETTDIILNELDKLGLKAAFFCVGNNVKKYPSLCNDIIGAGHLIGNHTFNHRKLRGLDRNSAAAEIDSFNHLLYDEHGYKVKYFRPPHGQFALSTKNILDKREMTNVMWSLLTSDYKNDLNLVKFVVDKYLKKNSIVVLHDSVKSKEIIINSINFIVEYAARKGFEIGEPDECLK